MTFAVRSSLHDAFQVEVDHALVELGWAVAPYGREHVLSATAQRFVHELRASERWRPDLICSRDYRVRLVDVKTCLPRNATSPNYAIEKDSLSGILGTHRHEGWRAYLVFHDWLVADVVDIWDATDTFRTIAWGGSGTSAWLVPRKSGFLRQFGDVFA